jgi:tRNA1Val (adenine37-N6)-methyltransferase
MLKQDKRIKDRFKFKQFTVQQDQCSMKVGTDGILLGAWADTQKSEHILDIGAGTGLIALMLAQRADNALIHAVEIDEKAYEQAQTNFLNAPWSERLTAFNEPVQDFAAFTRTSYDLIVSNPPFFTGGTLSASQDRSEVRHTIKLPTGDLLSSARRLLKSEGRFCVILPLIEGLRCKERAMTYGLHCTKIVEIMPKPNRKANRVLMQFEKSARTLEECTLTIRVDDETYTDDYIEMTKDFYLFL